MDFMLNIQIKSPDRKINYFDKIFVIGSCFTEHIGGRLKQFKFSVLQNPNGILFDPLSVCRSLKSYIHHKQYQLHDLFYLNEMWQSWQHHSVFSGMNQDQVIHNINRSQQQAHEFLQQSDWLIITLGSAFHYQLNETGEPVANCHRAPAQWFQKHLLDIDQIAAALDQCINHLFEFNRNIKVILTISPVRHIRDGVVENNRSKARLIEVVHHLVNKHDRLYYFPAYELVIDVLRDYRFYDIDLVHPNYAATEYVFEKFSSHYIEPDTLELMSEVKNIITAYRHVPFQSATLAHQQFLKAYMKKIQHIQQKNPHIDFEEEIRYFSQNADTSNFQEAL